MSCCDIIKRMNEIIPDPQTTVIVDGITSGYTPDGLPIVSIPPVQSRIVEQNGDIIEWKQQTSLRSDDDNPSSAIEY